MTKYNLSFISDDDFLQHVKDTVNKYRFQIDLRRFNRNLIDPIKLTFDSKVYGKSLKEIIETEALRQIDKSNTNHIGYFHQNIFKYIQGGWLVPETGYDVINKRRKIYAEMKNKHNTMNSASSQRTYIKMQDTILRDDEATCYLVEVISRDSQNVPWVVSIDGEQIRNCHIRKVSIDKFYEIVTGYPMAFRDVCAAIPRALDEVVGKCGRGKIENSVFEELSTEQDPDLIKSIYLLSFKMYEGFSDLEFQ